jgi:peptide/nickel transport system substrate-binding protein
VAALQAFLSGDLDYMEPPADQYAELATDQEFNEKSRALSYWEPSVPFFFIAWNEETSFFSDKLVRLAMTHIIDRETIKKELLKGDAKIVTGPFYIYGRQNDPNVKPWPYDPERAKELLDEAGWRDTDGDGIRDKDGKAFSFKFSYSTGLVAYEQLAKLFKDVAAQVGIEVVPDPYEWSVFVEKLQNHEFDALVIGYGGTLETDPYQIFHSSQIAGRGDNFISFRNAEADTIIEEARRAIDENKRYPLYHRLHRLLHEEQPFTFLFTRPERRFLDRRFENVIIHKLGLNPHEWYVPEELQKYK